MSKFDTKNMFDRHAQGFPLVLVQKNTSQPYFGRVATASDTNGPSCVVSTSIVNSNSLILFSVQNNWVSASLSLASQFCVATISPGGFFRIAAVNSSTNAGSFTVMYELKNAL